MTRKSTIAKTRTPTIPTIPTLESGDAGARPPTKKSQLIAMLSHGNGNTIAAISAAFGWQPHTTRAAITGLRKAGHSIETVAVEGGSGYRTAAPILSASGAAETQPSIVEG